MPCCLSDGDARVRCQFNVPESELIEFDGKQWCQYHLPMVSETGISSSKAGWDEAKIEAFNQDVFDRIKVVSDLNGTMVQANFSSVVFPGNIDFSNKTIPNVSFNNATFSGVVTFNSTGFSALVSFGEVIFERFVSFNKAGFTGAVRFNDTVFKQDADFCDVMFRNDVWFYGAIFEKNIQFNNAFFRSEAIFDRATFNGSACFDNALFIEGGRFNMAEFNAKLGFNDTVFKDDVWFKDAIFSDETAIEKFRGSDSAHFGAYPTEYEYRDED